MAFKFELEFIKLDFLNSKTRFIICFSILKCFTKKKFYDINYALEHN